MAQIGWTMVGTAAFEVTLVSRDAIINNKIAAINGEIKEIRADAQSKIARLEERMNSLLAITNEVEA